MTIEIYYVYRIISKTKLPRSFKKVTAEYYIDYILKGIKRHFNTFGAMVRLPNDHLTWSVMVSNRKTPVQTAPGKFKTEPLRSLTGRV